MTVPDAVALIAVALALPFVGHGVHAWRHAPEVADARGEAFLMDGWWVNFPWPWQRTVRGVKLEAATSGLAALILIVDAALITVRVVAY